MLIDSLLLCLCFRVMLFGSLFIIFHSLEVNTGCKPMKLAERSMDGWKDKRIDKWGEELEELVDDRMGGWMVEWLRMLMSISTGRACNFVGRKLNWEGVLVVLGRFVADRSWVASCVEWEDGWGGWYGWTERLHRTETIWLFLND